MPETNRAAGAIPLLDRAWVNRPRWNWLLGDLQHEAGRRAGYLMRARIGYASSGEPGGQRADRQWARLEPCGNGCIVGCVFAAAPSSFSSECMRSAATQRGVV